MLQNSLTCKAQDTQEVFRYPAEFEQQQAIWFGWEKEDTNVQMVVANIIQAITEKIEIKMAVSSIESITKVTGYLENNGVSSDKIKFYSTSGERFWIRDNGAVFVTNDNGKLGAVDFEWSNYGYYDWMMTQLPHLKDSIKILKNRMMTGDASKMDTKMANLAGAVVIRSKLFMEGGALETNGRGVLIQCEEVTLQRNPGWSKKEIEAEYSRLFNIKKVIWLKNGMADDAKIYQQNGKYVTLGTGGHVDEFVRFANPNTILLSWIDEEDRNEHPLNAISYKNMNENFSILQKALDQDGNPFKIIKVPVPSVIEWPVTVSIDVLGAEYDKLDVFDFRPLRKPKVGDKLIRVASVSYLNFLATNGAVINASYIKYGTSAEKEDRVKAIFREVFPDREQIWIDAFPVNRLGGGIHCITLQEPFPSKKENLYLP
jgi:agmatine deiminase